MCETNAYLFKDGGEEIYLENIDVIKPEGQGLFLRSLFGEEKVFEGRIREINMRKGKIVLEAVCDPRDP